MYQAHARGYHREDHGRLSLVILGSIGTATEELKIKPLFNILINKIRIFEVIILLMFLRKQLKLLHVIIPMKKVVLAVNLPYIYRLQNTYPMHCSDTTKTVYTLICKTVISTVSGVLLPVYFRSNEVVHPLDKIHLQTYILLTAGTQNLNWRTSKTESSK